MLLIKNGTLYTMSDQGILNTTDLLLDQGKIIAIGQNLSAENAEIVDASGLNVLPGFVDAHSHIGGFDMDTNADDLNELTKPLTPEVASWYGIDIASKAFDFALRDGITTSCIAPGSGNVICGLVCAVKSAGKSLEERTLKNPVALKAAMGVNPKGVYGPRNATPMSRLGIAQLFREYFLQVQDYRKKKEAGKEDPKQMPAFDQGLENGILVLEKKIPLKVHCYQHDMMSMLRIAEEFDFNLTLDHALGASDFYDEIAASNAAVIYGPLGAPLFGGEGCKVDIDCLIELDRRGVLCAIMTDGPVFYPYMIITQAGEVVRAGGEIERVLRMLTINPAKIIGCDDRVGSLEVGKDADVVLFQGIPALNTDARVITTIVDGKIVYQDDKEKK